jgi:hypothetical protein
MNYPVNIESLHRNFPAGFPVPVLLLEFASWLKFRHGDISGVEGLFRAVREQRAKKTPERGLWFSSSVKVGSQGGAVLCCNFMDEPKILDERPTIPAADYELDLQAFPVHRIGSPRGSNRRGRTGSPAHRLPTESHSDLRATAENSFAVNRAAADSSATRKIFRFL